MNQTTSEHVLKCFPDANVSKFDKFFFTRASEDDYAFICIKGAMEDFTVLVQGEFDDESLERRLFMLVNKFGGVRAPGNVYADYDEDGELIEDSAFVDSEFVRAELFQADYSKWVRASYFVVFALMTLLELLLLGFVYYISQQLLSVVGLSTFFIGLNVWVYRLTKNRKSEGDGVLL